MKPQSGSLRQNIVFISPAWPRPESTGLAMRAYFTAAALAKRHAIHMAVPYSDGTQWSSHLQRDFARVPQCAIPFSEHVRRFAFARARGLYSRLYATPGDWTDPASQAPREFAKRVSAVHPGRLHVFRLYMAPFAHAFLGNLRCELDLDESEARSRRRIAELARRNGDRKRAELLESEALFYERVEQEWLPRFDRIFAASEREQEYLLDRNPHLTVAVLPNVIELPASRTAVPPRRVARNGPFTMLFVGDFHHYPNEDAVKYFAEEILPLIKARSADIHVNVVGGGGSHALRHLLARDPAVRVLGFVSDLTPLYDAAHAAIVPLRAGGGTRIKILEAFAHGVPVVSTVVGNEGLASRPEEHLLIGDTPEEFAHACLRLMESPGLGDELSARAYALVTERYSTAALEIPD